MFVMMILPRNNVLVYIKAVHAANKGDIPDLSGLSIVSNATQGNAYRLPCVPFHRSGSKYSVERPYIADSVASFKLKKSKLNGCGIYAPALKCDYD